MKILAVFAPLSPWDDDFCDATPGEICVPPVLVCTSAGCCDRIHVGIISRQATTTVVVAETEWGIDQLVAVYQQTLTESELGRTICDDNRAQLAEAGREDIAQVVEVADDHPLGAVLRPRYDRTADAWFYDEVDE